jgi:hypothetical protein
MLIINTESSRGLEIDYKIHFATTRKVNYKLWYWFFAFGALEER